MTTSRNEEMMRRCLSLAAKGSGSVSPNPMVGCVIVKRGKVIGEGYHKIFGGAHAEVNAVRSAKTSIEGTEVYVSLEPCSHFGKTPPCVDLLIQNKVSRVYVSMLDPNPRVNGRGVRKLKRAGIKVEVGLLAEESRKLNEAFVKFISTGLPFVTLKAAQSLDGKIALNNGKSKYITSQASLKAVHGLRASSDAVLVGAGTVIADDPSLTVRLAKGRSPVRIVVDGRLRSPLGAKMFHDGASRVILYCSSYAARASARKVSALRKFGVEVNELKGHRDGRIAISTLLKSIGEIGITSVIVEGGTGIFSEFINSGAADRLLLFTAPLILGDGKGIADGLRLNELDRAVRLRDVTFSKIGVDELMTGYFIK